jgi:hypothetical protein
MTKLTNNIRSTVDVSGIIEKAVKNKLFSNGDQTQIFWHERNETAEIGQQVGIIAYHMSTAVRNVVRAKPAFSGKH